MLPTGYNRSLNMAKAAEKKPRKVPSAAGRRILDVIAELGITQNEFERRAGLSSGYGSRLIYGGRGVRLEPRKIFDTARALGVRPQWLWQGELPKVGNPAASGKSLRQWLAAYASGKFVKDVTSAVWQRYGDNEPEEGWGAALDAEVQFQKRPAEKAPAAKPAHRSEVA